MAELKVAPENAEATEAWNGPLFDVWQDFQAVVVSNAKAHGDAALADHHPERGDRVLDIGCGLGDSWRVKKKRIRSSPRLVGRGTALVPTDTSDASRSSRSADASDDPDAHGHIDTLNLSAGGRKVAGSNPVAPTEQTAIPEGAPSPKPSCLGRVHPVLD